MSDDRDAPIEVSYSLFIDRQERIRFHGYCLREEAEKLERNITLMDCSDIIKRINNHIRTIRYLKRFKINCTLGTGLYDENLLYPSEEFLNSLYGDGR